MKSELTFNVSADEFEMPPGCEVDADDDQAIAAMLAQAYDSPPITRSLTKRLDAGIAQQWGHSPDLAGTATSPVVTRPRPRQLAARLVWYAGAMAATVIFALVLMGGSGQYALASVIAAMRHHGVVRIAGDQHQRWLDLANGIACEQTPNDTKWIDLRRGVALTYVDVAKPPRQDSLRRADGSAPQSDSLLAVFLLGEPLSAQSLERFRDVRVVDEQVNEQGGQSAATIELQVEFATTNEERFDLSLQLDPQTSLPLTVAAANQAKADSPLAVDRRSLTYSKESAEQLRARLLDRRMDVASAEHAIRDNDADRSIATAETRSGSLPQPDSAMPRDLARDDSTAPIETASDKTDNDSDEQTTNDSSLVASLPIGAATQWKPVAVVSRNEAEVRQQVDRILSELWQREKIQPVEEAGELQLLRRAYLDLAGRTPTVTEVRDYSNDPSSDRYSRLVDHLLDSPDYASQMAAVWRSFLIPEGVDLNAFGGREAFEKWLAQRFGENIPYDQIVRELLLAEGRLSQSGPLLFYSALKLDADQLAARTSRVFLGMRLECAQCHDHPFEPWKQEDFWSYAAFFAQISRPKGMLETASTVMRVQDVERGEVMLPETEDVIQPRFLGESAAKNQDADPQNTSPRRQRLARWLTGADNPYFARATVNRVWSHMFGRGIVDPVDDFGVNHRPISPDLLDVLASQFIDTKFDLKTLTRTIALSRAYRLASSSDREAESTTDTEQRLKTFAQMNVKTLTAEQLYDCIAVATLRNRQNATTSQYVLSRFDNSDREQFLQQFAAPPTSRSEYLAGIPQALMLMNGSMIAEATGEASSGLIQSLDAPFFTDRQRIDVLFMATLSRPARPDELKLVESFVPAGANSEQRRIGLADLLWALINSSEFTLNH
ncbi:MAG: DUF1549 and DUF1553 domain-containing protein [Planctomycetaceae bacterium]